MPPFYHSVSLAASALFTSLDEPALLARHLAFAPNVDVREAEYNMTPLMCAAHNGYSGSARLLLQRGASVDLYDVDEYTALVHASIAGHIDIVRDLVTAGSSVAHSTSDTGNNSLMWAVAYDHPEIAMYLVEHCDVDCLNKQGRAGGTVLHLAALKTTMAEVVKKVIAKGGDYRIEDFDGNEPLMTAAYYGNYAVTAAILESRGPSQPGVSSSDVIEAMAVAQAQGYSEIVSLIEAWLGPNRPTVIVICF